MHIPLAEGQIIAGLEGSETKPIGAVVRAMDPGPGAKRRVCDRLHGDLRFAFVDSIRLALDLKVDLVVVDSDQPLADESELLSGCDAGAVASLFVSDGDTRRVSLLRAGAADVVGSTASEDEVRCRIDRTLEAHATRADFLRKQSELETLAYTDGLTGLANRRFFDEILAREVARANRFRRPMAVVLMDVDHFKRINDRLGHDAGDQIIRRIGEQLLHLTRSSDCAARFGGDEFAAVLGDIDASGAQIYAQRVKKALSEVVVAPDFPSLRCSLSVGISSYGEERTTAEDLLKRADRALYRAKATGRNRVEIARW